MSWLCIRLEPGATELTEKGKEGEPDEIISVPTDYKILWEHYKPWWRENIFEKLYLKGGFETGTTVIKAFDKENWVMFWNEVEKIKKLQMIAEFTDHDDKQDNINDNSLDKNNLSDSDYDSDDDDDNNKKKEKVKLKEVIVENTITDPQQLTNIINDPSQVTNIINDPSQVTNIIKDTTENSLNNIQEEIVNNIKTEVK